MNTLRINKITIPRGAKWTINPGDKLFVGPNGAMQIRKRGGRGWKEIGRVLKDGYIYQDVLMDI